LRPRAKAHLAQPGPLPVVFLLWTEGAQPAPCACVAGMPPPPRHLLLPPPLLLRAGDALETPGSFPPPSQVLPLPLPFNPARDRSPSQSTAERHRGDRAPPEAPSCPARPRPSTSSSRCINSSPEAPRTSPPSPVAAGHRRRHRQILPGQLIPTFPVDAFTFR